MNRLPVVFAITLIANFGCKDSTNSSGISCMSDPDSTHVFYISDSLKSAEIFRFEEDSFYHFGSVKGQLSNPIRDTLLNMLSLSAFLSVDIDSIIGLVPFIVMDPVKLDTLEPSDISGILVYYRKRKEVLMEYFKHSKDSTSLLTDAPIPVIGVAANDIYTASQIARQHGKDIGALTFIHFGKLPEPNLKASTLKVEDLTE